MGRSCHGRPTQSNPWVRLSYYRERMTEKPRSEGPALPTAVDHLVAPYVSGHADDVEILRELAAIALDIARNTSDRAREQVFDAFHRTGAAIGRFREEEAFAATADSGYVSMPGEPDVSREQIVDELRQDAEYDRFQFVVAAAAADPVRFREYQAGAEDERTARILREAATRAEELDQPSQEDIITGVYDAVIADVPAEWRGRVTNAFRVARGDWRAIGRSETVRRLSLFEHLGDEFPASSRPFDAKPLTGVRISELFADAMTTPAWQKGERTREHRERAAIGATRRFYVEALAADPEGVPSHLPADVVSQLPGLQREAKGVRRRAREKHQLAPPPSAATEPEPATRELTKTEALFADTAAKGRQLLELAIEGADLLRAARPGLTEHDRDMLATLARLAAAVDEDASPRHREQVQIWYEQVGSTLELLHRHESSGSAPALLAQLTDDAEWSRFRFLTAAAASDPDTFRARAFKIPQHMVDRATLGSALNAGREVRAQETATLDEVAEQVYHAVIDTLGPNANVRQTRVTNAYQAMSGMLQKARIVASDERFALTRALAGDALNSDDASPLTMERAGMAVTQVMATSAGRKLNRRAAHYGKGAAAQFESFLAEALAVAPEATMARLTPEWQAAVPELEPKVRRIKRKIAQSEGPPGRSGKARRRRGTAS